MLNVSPEALKQRQSRFRDIYHPRGEDDSESELSEILAKRKGIIGEADDIIEKDIINPLEDDQSSLKMITVLYSPHTRTLPQSVLETTTAMAMIKGQQPKGQSQVRRAPRPVLWAPAVLYGRIHWQIKAPKRRMPIQTTGPWKI